MKFRSLGLELSDITVGDVTREILNLFLFGDLDYEGRWRNKDYWSRKP